MEKQDELGVQPAALADEVSAATDDGPIESDEPLDALEPGPLAPEIDLDIEELLSAEGKPARDGEDDTGAEPSATRRESAFNGEASLDELLDTFADEELAAEAFAEALTYGGLPPVIPGPAEEAPMPSAAVAKDDTPSDAQSNRSTVAVEAKADAEPASPQAAPMPSREEATDSASVAPPVAGPSTGGEPMSPPPQRVASRVMQHSAARRAAPQPTQQPTQQPAQQSAPISALPARRRGGFWRGLGLVLLGGLLGVALTLLGFMIWSGTLSFASRAQVDALSRNMGTMQTNLELTWGRFDTLTPQLAEQERRVTEAEAALAQSQVELSAVREQAASAEARVETLGEQLSGMQQQLDTALALADARLATVEGQTTALDAGLAQLEEQVSPMQAAVQRFDGFLSSMRDLLIRLQGEP